MTSEALLLRLAALESENRIRRLMARYMELCDCLDETTPMDELASLFAVDAVWRGMGARYATAFGSHCGRDAIAAMLDAYRGPPPHFAMNAHFLCSESIQIEGNQAEGQWMMLQTSTYNSGSSDLRAAKLRVGFRIEDGDWRISCFEAENLFSRPVDKWDSESKTLVPD